MSELTNIVPDGAENGLYTGMILKDLQKGFDTIDHKSLLDKMKVIGFSNKTLKWLQSYLAKRASYIHTCHTVIHTCMHATQVSSINIRTEIKNVLSKEFVNVL